MKKSFFSISLIGLMLISVTNLYAVKIAETESNSTEGTAQIVNLNFTGNQANDTIMASLNSATDEDYYAISVPAGYGYEVSIKALDSYSLSSTFTTDIEFSSKNGSTWSLTNDTYSNGLFFGGASTIYIKAEHYGSTTNVGTYGIQISITKGTFQNINLSYTSNVAGSNTLGNIINQGDVAYYSVTFPAGYNYSLNSTLYDSYNANGGSYTCDAKFSYKFSTESNFGSTFDTNTNDIIIPGNSNLIFKVSGYYSDEVGSFNLNLASTRMTTDLMKIGQTSYTFNPLSQTTSNSVTCTGNWTASSDQSFVTFSQSSGTGNGYVGFIVAENTSYTSRTATVTLTYNGGTKTFTITQNSAIAPDSYETNNTEANASNISISYVSNAAAITILANTHVLSDTADIYKFLLPAGYTYTITSNLDDAFNSSGYTEDAKYNYKIGTGSWNSFEDTSHPTFTINNGGTLYIKVKPYYTDKVGTYALNVNISRVVSTDVQEAENKKILVYPNPSNGEFTVESEDEGNATIKVFSPNGNVVSSTNVSGNKNTIQTNLPSGNYIIQYERDGNTSNKKLIIKR